MKKPKPMKMPKGKGAPGTKAPSGSGDKMINLIGKGKVSDKGVKR